MRRLCLLAAILFFAGLSHAAEKPRMPIHAWVGIPQEQTTIERYKELADCGFTTSFSGFSNADAMTKALDVAQQAGIRLFLSCPELSNSPQPTVKRFKDHPALAAWYLRDEPNAADFPALGKWVRAIQEVDQQHPCYINLFPTYASPQQLGTATYQEHVDRFLKEVPVPVISFDHYPVVGKSLRGDWYQNLEIIRNAAIASKKPFWAFSLSVAHGPYPIPTLAHLRVQVFSDLAYGAQCIQYFTYWTPVDSQWNFNTGPIDARGNRTVVYDRVKQVNSEIQALADIFLGCRVTSVAHTGKTPVGTREYQPAPPVRSLRTEGPGAVVSTIENGRGRFLVIVNRDINAEMPLSIEFENARRIERITGNGQKQPLEKSSYSARIGPGDICIFGWAAD